MTSKPEIPAASYSMDQVGSLAYEIVPVLKEWSVKDVVANIRASSRPASVVMSQSGELVGYLVHQTFLSAFIEKPTLAWHVHIESLDVEVSADSEIFFAAAKVLDSPAPFLLLRMPGKEIQIAWQDEILARHVMPADDERKEALSNTRDELIDMVAHDLRSPLGVVKVCAAYLCSESDPDYPLSSEQSDFLDRISRNCDRALDLVRNLLDISRLESGAALVKRPVAVPGFIAAIVDNARFLGKDREIDVVNGGCDELSILIDPSRFEQIVDNFIGNALKFSPSGSKVTVSARFVQNDGVDGCLISVADQGSGIPAHEINEIFKKFHQAGDVQASRRLGVGLGLAIAQQFAKLHGATIQVESEEGVGSTFSIFVPHIVDAEVVPVEAKTILVVDDDNDIRTLVLETLEDKGFKTLSARNGQEGLEQFRQHRPDLVISDIKMPKMDGFELMQEVKAIDIHALVVLSSGYYPNLGNDIAMSVFRASALLSKPFSTDELTDLVAQVFKDQ